MSRKPPPFLTFFNFSSDVYNNIHIGLSHQTYTTNFTLNYHNSITQKISHTMMINYPRNPYDKRLEIMKMLVSEDITHDDDQLSTKPIRQKRLEIMKMMVSEDITHDDDQLSTKTTQDHEDDGIMEKESLFEDITHDDDQLSTKTTQDCEDDGIIETEDFEKKESLFEDNVCYILYLIVGVL